MCPKCFDTLLSILRAHCTNEQVNQILHILLGSGSCPSPEQNESEQCNSSQTDSEQELSCDEDSWACTLSDNATDWQKDYQEEEPLPNGQLPKNTEDTQDIPQMKLFDLIDKREEEWWPDATQESRLEACRDYANMAHDLKKLTLERQQHVEEQQHDFIHNLVDWSEYILDKIID